MVVPKISRQVYYFFQLTIIILMSLSLMMSFIEEWMGESFLDCLRMFLQNLSMVASSDLMALSKTL